MSTFWVLFFEVAQWFFLCYFLLINAVYLLLNILSILYIRQYTQERDIDEVPPFYSAYAPSISLIVPAYNEEISITASIRSLFQILYPDYEIIVVNDGSQDNTLTALIREFELVKLPENYRESLHSKKVRAVYTSSRHHNLRVIDKENGGKADSLNTGIAMSENTLVCCVDADSILQPDSLMRVVQPFIEDPTTIASGGTIRVANGCSLSGSFITKVGLPKNLIALIQVVEYLRAFLFGRLGWSPINALLIISGAFSVFRRDAILEVGGYRTTTVGEDMELVMRLHHHYRLANKQYKISFVPDPICWTEVPEDIKTLRNQRRRWQKGLGESLLMHKALLFHPKSGLVGWLAYPFMFVFELISPLIEVLGYLFMIIGFLFGIVSWKALIAFSIIAVGMGFLLSLSALLLEEISFHMYARISDIFRLMSAIVLENFGYRQLTLIWRVQGLIEWISRKGSWGTMKRNALAKAE